jgi:hypothetical protein
MSAMKRTAAAQIAPLPVDVTHTTSPGIKDWRFVVAPCRMDG